MKPIYDSIGKTYTSTRTADPRIVQGLINQLGLGAGASLIDVGAGSGNYSFALAESGFKVTAVEPSATMRAQGRPHDNLVWVNGIAEELPFSNDQFDGAMMILCLHHFTDWEQGLAEALRVTGAGPLALFTFDIEFVADFWLYDYFPEFIENDKSCSPTIGEIQDFVEGQLKATFQFTRFPLPKDLADHFAASGWARPEIYLEQKYRDGISSFSRISDETIQRGVARLELDLAGNNWVRKYGQLLAQESLDCGYVYLKIQRK